jgi:hypothetical protein
VFLLVAMALIRVSTTPSFNSFAFVFVAFTCGQIEADFANEMGTPYHWPVKVTLTTVSNIEAKP